MIASALAVAAALLGIAAAALFAVRAREAERAHDDAVQSRDAALREAERLRGIFRAEEREREELRRRARAAEATAREWSDLLHFPVVPLASRVHPCQKPLGLLSYLIRTATRPGDIVLDPFAGSGSTAVAALASGRRCVLVECEPSALALIRDRLDAEARAPRLFA